MNLFEYQGKKLFADYGVPVPPSALVANVSEIPPFSKRVVVKPQILMGGRGKAGAIQFCDTREEAAKQADYFLKNPVMGHLATKILIEESVAIAEEYYCSIAINRQKRCVSLMFSNVGGVNIEQNDKESIAIIDVNPFIGLRPYATRNLLSRFRLEHEEAVKETIEKLYALFIDKKMLLLEVNPLVITQTGQVMALDAKVVLDDWFVDAAFQSEEQQSETQTHMERVMTSVGANAVQMEGNIAVYAAGAGASMSLGDSIARRGGKLCAIIDRGAMPSDSPDAAVNRKIAEAYQSIVQLHPKAIAVNVFYQAGRIDYECKTLKMAFAEASRTIPVLVRCRGRMAEEGLQLFEGTQIRSILSYEELCTEAVRLGGGA